MKRIRLTAMVLGIMMLLGAAVWSGQSRAAHIYGLGDLAGSWKLTQVNDGRASNGAVQFSKRGELTKWVLIGVTQRPVSGRLAVSGAGKVSGTLSDRFEDRGAGYAYLIKYKFNLQFQSLNKITGSVNSTITKVALASGAVEGSQRLSAGWTLIRPKLPIARPGKS